MLKARLAVRLASCLAGGALAVLVWAVVVPWDLSEVDERGRALPRGGDEYAPEIALVATAVGLTGLALSLSSRTRAGGPWLTAGGLWAWAALFAWRAAVSRVSGANLFMVPLVFFFIPVALVFPLIVNAVGNWVAKWERRPG